MDRLTSLMKDIREAHPHAALDPIRSNSSPESWMLEVVLGKHAAVIQAEGRGAYGISSLPTVYGDGADERFEDVGSLLRRLTEILRGQKTVPRDEMPLSQIRAARGIPQREVARRLGVKQPAVSKIEASTDMSIHSLREILTASGASLEIYARLGDRRVRLSQFDVAPSAAHTSSVRRAPTGSGAKKKAATRTR